MNTKILLPILCLLPSVAGAAIPYRVEQLKMPAPAEDFSDINRFYIGGAYNFAMWQNYTDEDNVSVNGKNTSSFEFMAGYRIFDTFRMELNYLRTDAQYNAFSFSGDTFFVNAIWDARIDSMYRLFRSQMLVPYVGVGGGLSWNSADDGVHLDNKIAPVAAAMAGVSVEFNKIFALDFGYRYFYMFNPGTDIVSDLNPSAHQFRAGARISF
ncbi:MAG: outer membrane beta-barrel protein [Pseudomonadota bacterium]|nr:outer membrane beta-barrel protein [Pseudomonadota bacterium]